MSSSEVEQRITALRHDLKAWEKKFASEHKGRKAGRDDIKANEAISQKYKEYNKLRNVDSRKSAPQTPSKRAPTRKPSNDIERTPQRHVKSTTTTPLKRKRIEGERNNEIEQFENAVELTPQEPAMIGPTPQRDGKVLGLFDLLSAETPSKRRALADVAPNTLQTPSKNAGKAESETSLESPARGQRTPLSAGKRFMLDMFVTPKKRKMGEVGTPSSRTKDFSTPAFLRRHNALESIDEAHEPTPRPAPWKRRSFGRSLSSMIQASREQEEQRLDDEADIMRELEMEEEGLVMPNKKTKTSEVLVQDSQAPMPLGPDRGIESEEEEELEEGLDPDRKPRKAFKKRGQKRQTRRVIIRPNFAKPKPPPTTTQEDESDEHPARVPETQVDPNIFSDHGISEDDDDGSDYASDDSHTPKKRKTQHKKSEEAATSQAREDKASKPAGSVKQAARKVAATAHANYRRLKIKSKSGNGGKGKFGRKR